ncbi:MAG: hypothetical protein U0452_01720 [Anaerolineae bacterium]
MGAWGRGLGGHWVGATYRRGHDVMGGGKLFLDDDRVEREATDGRDGGVEAPRPVQS